MQEVKKYTLEEAIEDYRKNNKKAKSCRNCKFSRFSLWNIPTNLKCKVTKEDIVFEYYSAEKCKYFTWK